MPETQTAELVPLEANSPFVMRVHLSRNVTDTDARAALESGEMGFLHSFTTGSVVDGPGVRVVAWTAGCMFHCLFCHNPDTWDMKNGMPTTIRRATEELRKYRSGLKAMSGGLTVSGGEPLMQHRFVLKLIRAATNMGIHTALDTNGYLGSRLTDDDLRPINLVIMSIKAWDTERHRRLTGFEIEPTLAFARRLADLGKPLWIRYVLVPGLTDDVDEISHVAQFAASLGNVERVEVLPFHQMGRYKWKVLGMDYTLENVEPPSTELVEHACEQFRSVGLDAR
jgi:pyruvate formate lyase activating enzyme